MWVRTSISTASLKRHIEIWRQPRGVIVVKRALYGSNVRVTTTGCRLPPCQRWVVLGTAKYWRQDTFANASHTSCHHNCLRGPEITNLSNQLCLRCFGRTVGSPTPFTYCRRSEGHALGRKHGSEFTWIAKVTPFFCRAKSWCKTSRLITDQHLFSSPSEFTAFSR